MAKKKEKYFLKFIKKHRCRQWEKNHFKKLWDTIGRPPRGVSWVLVFEKMYNHMSFLENSTHPIVHILKDLLTPKNFKKKQK